MHSYVSPSVIDLLGYSPEEFIRIPFLKILVPSQSEQVKKTTAARLAAFLANPDERIFYTDEFQLIAKNGSIVQVEATYRFIINEDTGEPEIVAVTRRITEKRF